LHLREALPIGTSRGCPRRSARARPLRNLPARRPRGRLDRLARHELALALDQFLLAIPAVDGFDVPAEMVLALFDPDSQVLAILAGDYGECVLPTFVASHVIDSR